jgi:hypothetical protein
MAERQSKERRDAETPKGLHTTPGGIQRDAT